MFGRAPKVVVVGAGVGGLAASVDLAAHGCRVLVLDRFSTAGGKARGASVGGVSIDGGPTVVTMPWVFDELFHASGGSFRSEVPLEKAVTLARHAWPDGKQLDLFADAAASEDAIASAFGATAGRGYREFRAESRRIYETVEGPFLRSQRPSVGSLALHAGVMGLGALRRIDGFRTMWRALEKRFEEPRLRQLFGRYATYCGSSPFEAPATLNLVSHVEAEGVYRVRGGIRHLAHALELRARALGVDFLFGTEVDEIDVQAGRARGVCALGTFYEADAVLFNGDVSALAAGLLGRAAAPAVKSPPPDGRSLSAVIWTLAGRAEGFPLLHHNVFFSRNYAAEFDDLLRRSRAPENPTVYVCAQDRGEAPSDQGVERLLVLINAPPTGDQPSRWQEPEIERCERVTRAVLESAGLRLRPSAMVMTSPAELARDYPGTGGALYGSRSTGSMSAFSRAAAVTRIPGLYLAGGSAHPGPGVPMAALSGRLAAARMLADLGSTRRSLTAATAGTTSTA